MKNKSIGVFDSGLGGLTVLNKIIELLPNENIVYLGDTLRVPYGTRDMETIKRFSVEVAEFLLKKDTKALVVACNTMSSIAIDEIREISNIPVIEVIEPGSLGAIENTKNKKIGIIATDGTIKSKAYNKTLKKKDEEIVVEGVGCPRFVEIIESGNMDKDLIKEVAKGYLNQFNGFSMDTLILGCTHYPIIEREIKEVLEEIDRKNVKLIDPALETAKATKKILKDLGILNNSEDKGNREYLVTGNEDIFKTIGNNILNSSIDRVYKVDII